MMIRSITMSGIEGVSKVGKEPIEQKYSLTNPDDNFFKKLLDGKIQGALGAVPNTAQYNGGPIFGNRGNDGHYGIANG